MCPITLFVLGIAKWNDYRFGKESPCMRMTSFPSKVMSIDNVAYSVKRVPLCESSSPPNVPLNIGKLSPRMQRFFAGRSPSKACQIPLDVHLNLTKLCPPMQRLFTSECPPIAILIPNFEPLSLAKFYINDSGRVICCRLCLYLAHGHDSIALSSAVFWSTQNEKDEMSIDPSFGKRGVNPPENIERQEEKESDSSWSVI